MINGLLAVGRQAQRVGYDGPALGPAESSENKREFTEEQLMVTSRGANKDKISVSFSFHNYIHNYFMIFLMKFIIL